MKSITRRFQPRLEELEGRLALATLVNPNTVTFQDVDGDLVTVRCSLPVFEAGTIDQVFTFDPDVAFGDNSVPQQLLLIDLAELDAAGAKLAVTAVLDGGGNGFVDIGFIKANGLDLKSVTVAGDLGRIRVGDDDQKIAGLGALKVQSLGKIGPALAGGSLESTIAGGLGQLIVQTDVDQAFLTVFGQVGRISIGGSLLGGGDDHSGNIVTGGVGSIVIRGDVVGSSGDSSGQVYVIGNLGSLSIGGSVKGGSSEFAGCVLVPGSIRRATINGDLVGGTAEQTGHLLGARIGRLSIGGSLIGFFGEQSGSILVTDDLGPTTIGGDLLGFAGVDSGSVVADSGRIASISVAGSVQTGAGLRSASIRARKGIGKLTIQGNLQGSAAQPAVISAEGEFESTKFAIGKLTVGGSVTFANILAGYESALLTPKNADASIGIVTVGGDWTASNLVAGAVSGADGFFGTADDAKIVGANVNDSPDIVSQIKKFTITGAASGSGIGGDNFGVVAEQVLAVFAAGTLPLTAGPQNDDLVFGATNDLTVHEV